MTVDIRHYFSSRRTTALCGTKRSPSKRSARLRPGVATAGPLATRVTDAGALQGH